MESTFASRIRQYRQERGLSQSALAELCGLTQGNIAHMENGTEPKQSNVSKLVAGLPDLNPDWLLTGTGPMLRDGRALTKAEPFLPGGEVTSLGATKMQRGALAQQLGENFGEDDGKPRAEKTPTTAQEFIAGLLKENQGLRNELTQLKAENGKLYTVITDQQHSIRTSQEQISVLLGKSYGSQYAPVTYTAEPEAPAPIGFGRVRSMYNYATFGVSMRKAA